MITSILLALGLSTSPSDAVEQQISTPVISIEQEARRAFGKTRIQDSLNTEEARRAFGKTRIQDSLNTEEARRAFGKTRI